MWALDPPRSDVYTWRRALHRVVVITRDVRAPRSQLYNEVSLAREARWSGHAPKLSFVQFYVRFLNDLKLTSAGAPEQVPWLVCNLVVAGTDAIAAVALLLFAGYHVYLVLYNKTTLGSDDEEAHRFHVGWHANWCQVFGTQWSLWLLPLLGSGPSVDGLDWPENPKYVPPADEEVGAFVRSRDYLAATGGVDAADVELDDELVPDGALLAEGGQKWE